MCQKSSVTSVVCDVALLFHQQLEIIDEVSRAESVSLDLPFCVVVDGDVSGSRFWRLAWGASLPRTRGQIL